MTVLADLEPVARLVVATLFNGLWQGLLIVVAVWSILRAFARVNASTRYAAWSLALLAVVILPVVTTLPRITVVAPASVRATVPTTIRPAGGLRRHALSSVVRRAVSAPVASRAALPPVALPQPARFFVPGAPATILFAFWLLAALFVTARLVLSLFKLERLKRDALPLGVEYRDAMHRWKGASKGSREVRLCVSDDIDVPVAVGLFDSMILLPRRLLDRMEAQEIDQISLHELAHLRRADDWTNGVQRLAQALLFFNPAIAFIARQMDLEREVACDDWVLSLTGDIRPYAFCLTKMAEATAWPHRALAAPGVFVTRKSISIRIERLLAVRRAIGSALAPGASAAVIGTLVVIVLVVQMVTPSIAYTGPGTAVVSNLGAYAAVAKNVTPITKSATAIAATAVAASSATLPPRAIALEAVNCMGCDYHAENLTGRNFSGAKLLGADFHGADLFRANFRNAQLIGVDFRGADLRDASFANANLQGCDLRNARLDDVDFTGSTMTGCQFSPSALSPAQAAVVLRSCMGCDFAKADLRGRDLRNIELTGVDLSHADLRGSDLRGARLEGVDLSYARLDGAKLDGAQLIGCELRGVDLHDVDISHASLTGSSFDGTNFR